MNTFFNCFNSWNSETMWRMLMNTNNAFLKRNIEISLLIVTQYLILNNIYGMLTKIIRKQLWRIFIRRPNLWELKSLWLKRNKPMVGSKRLIVAKINIITDSRELESYGRSLGSSGSNKSNKSIESKISKTTVVVNSLMHSIDWLLSWLRCISIQRRNTTVIAAKHSLKECGSGVSISPSSPSFSPFKVWINKKIIFL